MTMTIFTLLGKLFLLAVLLLAVYELLTGPTLDSAMCALLVGAVAGGGLWGMCSPIKKSHA
jgi:multisubunit Na+/H+ antiporter MnhF subunit